MTNIYYKIILFTILSGCSVLKDSKVNKMQQNNDTIVAFVVSGPSGVGKDTVVNQFLKSEKGIIKAVSTTTREKRKGEQNGISYNFVKKEEFENKIKNNSLIEYTSNFGNYYGVEFDEYSKANKMNKDIVFVIDSKGLSKIKESKKMKVISIFIAPPSYDELLKRLKGRGSDDEKAINARLKNGIIELNNSKYYDYIIYNCDVQKSVDLLAAIYNSEKYKAINGNLTNNKNSDNDDLFLN